jgi:hypothetical protein
VIEKIASALSSATVGALAREASVMSRASEAVAGPFARAGGVSGFLGNLSPEVENGRQLRYSLKLPHGAGTVAKVMHYGVQPLILGKNIVDVAHSVGDLKKISPDKLIAAGIEPNEAERLYREAKGSVVGKAVGDAAAWSLYPLSIKNTMLHYPIVAGGAMAAPRMGEYLGKQLSTT